MVGTTLNHYTIVEPLGKGGMGEVYLARDTKLNRRVALKVLDPGTATDPSRRARFEREAQAIAALNHPNIVTVYSVEEAGETHFITMELIEGTTLSELLRPGGMELNKLFDIGVALSDALAAAHQQGITHRDLKPDNIMITRDGRVKVLDFGLAKLLEDDAATGDIGQLATRELTQPGLMVGTVPYMSPEQIEGKPLDGRSDIFSLGIILFQMATGSRPFEGESGPSLMTAILRDPPPSATANRTDLPRHLGRIIQRCLEKDPDNRYQSARDVRYELRSVVRELQSGDSEPSPAPQPAGRKGDTRREKKERRQTHPAVTITAIVAGMIIAVVAITQQGGNPDRERGPAPSAGAGATEGRLSETARSPSAGAQYGRIGSARPGVAVLPLANLSGDAEQEYFADGMTEALITDLAKIDGLRVISRGSVMRYKNSGTTIPEIAGELGVAYVLEGSVLTAGNRVRITTQLIDAAQDVHLWAEDYEEDLEDILSVQARVAREVAGHVEVKLSPADEDRLSGAYPVNPEAYQLYLKGRNVIDDRTVESLRRGLDLFDRALAVDPGLAPAWAGKGAVIALLAEYSAIPSPDAWRRAKAAARKALELDDHLSEAYALLGEVHHYGDWNYDAAEWAFRRAIDLNPGNATAHQWYGEMLSTMGRGDEARSELDLALELDPHSKVKRSSRVLFGELLVGRSEQAVVVSRAMVEDEPDYWLAHWVYGMALDAVGRYREAVPVLRRAGELSSSQTWTVACLAATLARSGDEAGARGILNDLLERSKSDVVLPSYIALVYTSLGDFDEAFAQLNEAIRQRDNTVAIFRSFHFFDALKADPRYEQTLAAIEAARRE